MELVLYSDSDDGQHAFDALAGSTYQVAARAEGNGEFRALPFRDLTTDLATIWE